MPHDFQIRIRTPDITHILCVADYIDAATAGFAFHHNLPDNNHYHIYLFGLDRQADSIRKTLGKYIPDKECYAVKTTCGGRKNLPITHMGAYQYGTTKKLLSPYWHKGFTDDNIRAFHLNAQEYYDALEKPIEGTLITREEHYVVRPDRIWEGLSQNKELYENLTVKQIKSKIAAKWLNAGKAMPRPSDLHRYATSLYYVNKYKDQEIPDGALEDEFH